MDSNRPKKAPAQDTDFSDYLSQQKIVVIDNFDSFVYNLVQYIGETGANPIVFRADKIDL
ncbi:glutamine amidotransferase of anthranilate synthase, partial [mine drainage metagenome]